MLIQIAIIDVISLHINPFLFLYFQDRDPTIVLPGEEEGKVLQTYLSKDVKEPITVGCETYGKGKLKKISFQSKRSENYESKFYFITL